MAEFWLGTDPGIPLEEVYPIPGLAMPKDEYLTPSDAPGVGLEIGARWIGPFDYKILNRNFFLFSVIHYLRVSALAQQRRPSHLTPIIYVRQQLATVA